MEQLFLFGTVILGAMIMWCGTVLQMSENPSVANDAKVLLGVGVGVVLAGCGFAFTVGLLHPDQALEAQRQAMAVKIVTATAQR